MKYTNANDILPKELIDHIQNYIQGKYIYIPIRDKCAETSQTDYKIELTKRDNHIYTKHLEGVSNKRLSQMYNLSESSIRRIIIKQKRSYNVMVDKVSEIITHWNLSGACVKQIYDTAWQIGNDYILKVYDNPGMLERNVKILSRLDKINIPVGRIIYSNENGLYVSDGEKYYFLSETLQGSNIVSLDTELASLMGETIATLHKALKECEREDIFWNNSLLNEMNGWIREAFELNDWQYVSKETFEKVLSSLSKVYDELPVQLIHRDVHLGNFLFDNGKFSGYIDFDLSQRNIRIFDLCYFMLGLLSEEEKLEISTNKWFDFLAKVFKGYDSRIKLSDVEKKAVPYVMEGIELLFVAYFLKQKDIVCVENALKIFKFVRTHEDEIYRNINGSKLYIGVRYRTFIFFTKKVGIEIQFLYN